MPHETNSFCPIRDGDRATLRALADLIVPRDGRMPCASDVGLAETGGAIDAALGLRPDLIAPLRHLLAACSDTPSPDTAWLMRYAAQHPETMRLIVQLIAGAYYAQPEVGEKLGFTGPQDQPVHIVTRA